MLAARLNVSNTILWFLAFVSSAIADPVCDPIYGQPTYTDCSDLVLALYDGWPGQIPDRKEHYFSLSGEEPSPWIDPELGRLRIYLPKFVFQGQPALIDHGRRFFCDCFKTMIQAAANSR